MPSRSWLLTFAAGIVASLLLSPSAPAAPRAPHGALRVAERSVGPLAADGDRFVAGSQTSGTGIVLDDTSGSRRSVPCSLGAPRAGRSLAFCSGEADVVDLRSLGRVPVRGMQEGDLLGAYAGARWIDGSHTDPATGATEPFFLDWRTGARTSGPSGDPNGVDLDGSSPSARPLARGSTLLGRSDARIAISGPVGTLRLRQGARRVTIRRRCAKAGCRSVQYAGGVVSWIEDAGVCAYVVRTRRLGCRTPSRAQRALMADFTALGASHTSRNVYATVGARAGGWLLLRVSLRDLVATGAGAAGHD
jgi:hypothetical protein